MNENHPYRDPWTLTALVITIFVNLAIGFYWGGSVSSRVSTLEARETSNESSISASIQINQVQERELAVLTTKLDDIKDSLDKANRKLDRGR